MLDISFLNCTNLQSTIFCYFSAYNCVIAGTSWIIEIVWLIKNEANVEKANQEIQDVRVPYLEIDFGQVM